MTFLHGYAILMGVATFFLVIAGGMVTSTGSGLAVPDWPLSFGQFFPPMVGGVFYEHGHRLVAAAIGFFTVLLAVSLWRGRAPAGIQRLGWAAVGLVIVQGLLGGVTVLLKLPTVVSVSHAMLGQIFFSIMVLIAVLSGEPASAATPVASPHTVKLRRLATLSGGLVLLQLLLGALYRHTLTPGALHLHMFVAAVVLGHVLSMAVRAHLSPGVPRALTVPAALAAAVVLLQIVLGLFAWRLPFPGIRTAHQATGALLLAAVVVAAVQSTRRLRPA